MKLNSIVHFAIDFLAGLAGCDATRQIRKITPNSPCQSFQQLPDNGSCFPMLPTAPICVNQQAACFRLPNQTGRTSVATNVGNNKRHGFEIARFSPLAIFTRDDARRAGGDAWFFVRLEIAIENLGNAIGDQWGSR